MTTDYNDGLEEIESEELDLESTPATYEVITYPADFTLEGLVSKEALIKRRQAEKYRHAIKSKRSRIGFNINASKSRRFLQ